MDLYPDEQGRLTSVMAAKLNACLNMKEAARSMHEKLRELLLNVAADRGANLRLVACLPTRISACLETRTIQIFFPDMHILSKARRNIYSYGLNHGAMLQGLVARLDSG